VVTTAGGDYTTYSVSDIKSINPEPWMLGQGFKWSGFVSFSWDIESGNTDKNELDYLLDTQWRKGSTRWILKGEGESDKVSNEKNADNWTLMGIRTISWPTPSTGVQPCTLNPISLPILIGGPLSPAIMVGSGLESRGSH